MMMVRVIVDMRQHLAEILEEFPEKLTGNAKTPANDNLFRVMDGATFVICQPLYAPQVQLNELSGSNG